MTDLKVLDWSKSQGPNSRVATYSEVVKKLFSLYFWTQIMSQSWDKHKLQKSYSYMLSKRNQKTLWFFPNCLPERHKQSQCTLQGLSWRCTTSCKSLPLTQGLLKSLLARQHCSLSLPVCLCNSRAFLYSLCSELKDELISRTSIYWCIHIFCLLTTVLMWNIIQKNPFSYKNKVHARSSYLHTLGLAYDG